MLSYSTPQASADIAAYPKPQIPKQPILSLASFGKKGRAHIPSVLDARSVKFVTSGRVAIALALREMKIGAGDKVLVPAYHCASMVEPVIWTGATPVFYKVNSDTSVDLEDIRSKLDGSTKVLMATNYFGFPQPLAKLRGFCDENGMFLLEDCAHSFMGEHGGQALGTFGDYAIASSMKFFPVYEGGCLVSARHSIEDVQLDSAGPGFEVKAAFDALEKGFEYDRMAPLKLFMSLPLGLKKFLWGRIKKRSSSESISLAPGASDGGFGFQSAWINKRSSFFSRHLVRLASKSRIATKRRENYITLNNALSGLPGCRPLFPALPDGVFPYVYPLLTDHPAKLFPVLKNAGVPVIRFGEYLWPGVDADTCSVSVELSERVMQFPCHQDLLPAELAWMIDEIKSAILQHGHE
jgi:perosamine synthetase